MASPRIDLFELYRRLKDFVFLLRGVHSRSPLVIKQLISNKILPSILIYIDEVDAFPYVR